MNYESDAEFPGMSGIAWYKREQWALLKSVSADADELEDTYDEWLEYAKRHQKDIWDTGINIFKVDVDVEELIRWCQDQGRPVDGAARAEFVSMKLKEQPPE